jgi:Tol biopolymer transport system component
VKLLLVLLVAAVVVSAAAAGPNEERPTDLLTFTFSPRADPENGQYLTCAQTGGAQRVRVVPGDVSTSGASWSPDGSRVAFTGWNLPVPFGSSDDDDIVVADADGRLLANLTRGFSASNFLPKWSADGRWIAFSTAGLTPAIVRSDGSAAPRLVPVENGAGDLAWFPNGQQLVVSRFVGNGVFLFSVKLDGKGSRRLTRGTEPAVSPNGKKLAFTRVGGGTAHVFVANVDGSHVRRLTKSAKPESEPSWSQDGKWIAFVRIADPQVFFPHTTIVVAAASGKPAYTAVTGTADYDPFYPAWRRAPLPNADRPSC